MATLNEIRQRIEALRTEARGLHAGASNGALDAAAETRFAAIEAEVATLRASERRAQFVDDLDRGTTGVPVGDVDPRFEQLRSGVSLSAVIRAQLREHRDTAEAGRVREVSAELARRSGRTPANGLFFDLRTVARPAESRQLTTGGQGTTPNGAALVPLAQRPDLFADVMRNNLVIERAGARVLTDLQGNIAIPRRTTSVVPAFVREGENLPLSDGAYDQLTMKPKTAGVVSQVSRNLVMQSSPSVEALVQDDQAKTLAQAIDLAALLGDGVGAMPLGVVPQATHSPYTQDLNLRWPDILGAGTTLELANAQPNAWVLGQGVRARLMQTPKAQIYPNLSQGVCMDDPNTLAGVQAFQTNNLGGGKLLLGDFTELFVGYWSAVEIVVNEFAQDAFMQGAVLIRAIVSMDVLVRQPSAFVYLSEAAN